MLKKIIKIKTKYKIIQNWFYNYQKRVKLSINSSFNYIINYGKIFKSKIIINLIWKIIFVITHLKSSNYKNIQLLKTKLNNKY